MDVPVCLLFEKLWVFTPDLIYSTTSILTKHAMKIFYKTVTDPFKTIEDQSNQIEELQLPAYALKTLQADLKASTNILPPSAQNHQGWTIGILDYHEGPPEQPQFPPLTPKVVVARV